MTLTSKMLIKQFFISSFICVLLLLQGCVTTVEGPFNKKADKHVAELRYIELGLAYIQRHQFKHARKSLTRAKELNADSYGAFAAMGILYQQEEEYQLAEKEFLKALDINEKYTRGRTWYAAFLFSRQRYTEALSQFQLAANDTSYTSRSQVFINIGHTAEQLKKYDLAEKAYLKVQVLDANDTVSLIELIDLQIKQDKFSAAKYYYQRLLLVIRSGAAKHSLKTLGQGFIISHHFNNKEGQNSFLLLMKNLYPTSSEYLKYKAM